MRYAHHAPELTPGIFDRLADDRLAEGGDVPADTWSVDDSSTFHPLEIEKARNGGVSGS
jgi:hypothetical protein